jgi:hypothetical protein
MKFPLIILIISLSRAKTEKYSAIAEMEKLAIDEKFILEEFKSFVNEIEKEYKYLVR